MGTYAFDQARRKEHSRLTAWEPLLDPASQDLAGLGVAEGRRCLEVGAGGVARWLADRVGPTGQVLATGLDTPFLRGHRRIATEAGRDVLA